MNILTYKNRAVVFFLLLFSLKAQAAVLLDSSFTGTSPSQNTPWMATDSIDPNLNYSGWNLAASGGAPNFPGAWAYAVDNVFGFMVCHNVGYPSSLGDAVNENHYIAFTISPKSGSLNLNNKKVIFKIQRLNDWGAPLKYSVFTSVGGFQAGAELFTGSVSSNGDYTANTFSFIMPETGYDNITGEIEFRIYAYHTTYCWHPTSLTDFVIQDSGPLSSLSLTSTVGGTVTSEPQGVRFEAGTVVQLKATPDPGYHFTGWSGDISGKGNPRSITMTSNVSVTANFATNVNNKMQVGMNLSGIADWQTNHPFVDLFKMSRTWLTRSTSGGWESFKNSEIPMDQYGWPTHLPFTAGDGSTHYVHTIFNQKLVGGDYKVTVTGTGKMAFFGAVSTGTITLTGGTREISLPIPAGNTSNLQVVILESQSADPVRNIKIIRPGYLSTETRTFQPSYLDVLEPFGVLRFMGWGATNGSPLITWGDRTLKATYTQARPQGVALEYMVEAANTLRKDLWINIPHAADDDYVRHTARLLRDTVGPNQKIYVEYSNETWNTSRFFPQTIYVQDMGQVLNLDSDRWTAGQKYAVLRSTQIWKIFQEEFGADARVVRVLGTQVARKEITDIRVAAVNDPAINPNYLMPDVLAIAPYFGHNYTPSEIPPTTANYPTVDDILNEGGTAAASIAEQQSYVRTHKAIADTQGMVLECYEAGQHFIGIGGAENDVVLTDILIAVNRDNRMYDRYTDYLAMLDAEGVSACAHSADISRPDKWGSWGALEYLGQPVSEAPKYRALVDFITDSADLTVSSTVNPGSAYLNDSFTYTHIITNYGPWGSSNVTLVDTLPTGVAFVSATPQGSCTHDNGVVTCNLGSLASGASTTVTITATATATGTLTNAASVSGSGADPNPGNNTTTATVTVIAPDLVPTAMSATKSGKTVYVSDTVQNQGNGAAGAFTVAYYLSTNTTYEAGTDIPLASNAGGSGSCTRTVTSLALGATDSATNKACYKPSGAIRGTQYYVLVVDDAGSQVAESSETNNARATAGRIKW